MSAGPDTDLDQPDGRTARMLRNRELVLDAVLELFTEDSLEPAAADVAERSGVSLRSVYRYFEDGEALVRAAIARNMERIRPLFEIADLGLGPLPDRVERMVTARLRLYEAIAPMMRASLQRAPTNDIIRDRLDADLAAMRRQVEQMFAHELEQLPGPSRRDVTAALDLLLGFPSFEQLRRTREFPGPDTRRILVRAVASVLAGPEGEAQTQPPA